MFVQLTRKLAFTGAAHKPGACERGNTSGLSPSVTRVIVRFVRVMEDGRYAWLCHILDHEELLAPCDVVPALEN
jgi:FtsP/CotA-like multicopper oxidase with cupredoxin domain